MRIRFTLLGLFLIINLFSQENRKLNFELSFGDNFSIPYKWKAETMLGFNDHPITHYGIGMGYFVGLKVDYKFNTILFIQSGIELNKNKINFSDNLELLRATGIFRQIILYDYP